MKKNQKKQKTDLMFAITELAAQKIRQIADEENYAPFVRVKLKGGGCLGMTRSMEFEKESLESDIIIEFDGVKIFIDEVSGQYMEQATLDYRGGLLESGFVFNDPGQTSSCGCGKSVGY